jgi:betaine-aldehyde dehydrogenase
VEASSPVLLNDRILQAALSCFPRDRAMWIDSEEVEGGGGATFDRSSPAHGTLVTRAPRGTAVDVDRAIAAAHKAFDLGTWPKMSPTERSSVLLKTADLIDRDRELLAHLDSLESGKPISQARGEVAGTADIWRYVAALARTLRGESYASLGSARIGLVLREPIGVVSIITPWNFPLLIVSQKLPFALAAGCTCVVKPSEMTSASTLHLARLLDEAGLPKGVCMSLLASGLRSVCR